MILSTSPQHASYDAPDESDEEIMRAQRESEGWLCMPTSRAVLKMIYHCTLKLLASKMMKRSGLNARHISTVSEAAGTTYVHIGIIHIMHHRN